ncbi:MAG: hypothetical protein M3O70_01090 [Actinomycetota bacterium]|nr:hypothetical protein [Actinomycetota bacterium]
MSGQQHDGIVGAARDQEHAGWLLDRMQSGEVMAPAHQPAEVLSAIARLQRAGGVRAPGAHPGSRRPLRALAEERSARLLTTHQRLV